MRSLAVPGSAVQHRSRDCVRRAESQKPRIAELFLCEVKRKKLSSKAKVKRRINVANRARNLSQCDALLSARLCALRTSRTLKNTGTLQHFAIHHFNVFSFLLMHWNPRKSRCRVYFLLLCCVFSTSFLWFWRRFVVSCWVDCDLTTHSTSFLSWLGVSRVTSKLETTQEYP